MDRGMHGGATGRGWQLETWHRRWGKVGGVSSGEPEHAIEPGELGEYAALLRRYGFERAEAELPWVHAHIDSDCARCRSDLLELLILLG